MALNTANTPKGRIRAGETLFKMFCIGCHGPEGKGLPSIAPTLHSDWVSGDREILVKVLLKGLGGQIKVNGELQNYEAAMPGFGPALGDDEIASILDIDPRKLDSDLDRAITVTDFRTLLVPLKDLSDLESIVPDANKIRAFCRRTELDTIFAFAPSQGDWSNGIRCREFCPAIGSLESAASGTTNRSVSCFLYQRGRLPSTNDGSVRLSISQGVEMARPSHITSVVSISAGNVSRVDIGGRAIKVLNGTFLSPF